MVFSSTKKTLTLQGEPTVNQFTAL